MNAIFQKSLLCLCLCITGSFTINAQITPHIINIVKNRKLNDAQKKEVIRQNNLPNFQVAVNLSKKNFSSESNPGILDYTLIDSDKDGLSDDEEAILKTDPLNQDTDGDALIDSWEVGIINSIDLKALGASPLHKDIFVEMDYMVRQSAVNGLGPNTNVIFNIQQAFANSPISNPDGKDGINIHLLLDNEVQYDNNLAPLLKEFATLKKNNFAANRAHIFHYMIWADTYNYSRSSGSSLDIPSSDFVVTLGVWNNNSGGTDEEKIGTFIHELGHNLGLRHGGNDDQNYKPNHLSVMNYFFQISGVVLDNSGSKINNYTYQSFVNPELDESSLIEDDGIGKNPNLRSYYTRYINLAGGITETIAGGPIDWNTNGIIDENKIYVDLNSDTQLNKLIATPNEWNQLYFNGGIIGSFGPLIGVIDKSINEYNVLPFIELTEEMSIKIKNNNK